MSTRWRLDNARRPIARPEVPLVTCLASHLVCACDPCRSITCCSEQRLSICHTSSRTRFNLPPFFYTDHSPSDLDHALLLLHYLVVQFLVRNCFSSDKTKSPFPFFPRSTHRNSNIDLLHPLAVLRITTALHPTSLPRTRWAFHHAIGRTRQATFSCNT